MKFLILKVELKALGMIDADLRNMKKNKEDALVHDKYGRLIRSVGEESDVCLFACLVFNGTFSTNRLYCDIAVG